MYKIEIDNLKKLFIIKGIGLYKENELFDFIDTLKSKIKSIIPSEYMLVLDTSKLKASEQKSLPIMNDIIKIYLETPFKKRFYIQSESIISDMQMKRVGKKEFLENITIISDIKDIYLSGF